MTDLFPIEPSLSPFARWKLANSVFVDIEECQCEETGECHCTPKFRAHAGRYYGRGETEILACYRLAKLDGLVWFQTREIAK